MKDYIHEYKQVIPICPILNSLIPISTNYEKSLWHLIFGWIFEASCFQNPMVDSTISRMQAILTSKGPLLQTVKITLHFKIFLLILRVLALKLIWINDMLNTCHWKPLLKFEIISFDLKVNTDKKQKKLFFALETITNWWRLSMSLIH